MIIWWVITIAYTLLRASCSMLHVWKGQFSTLQCNPVPLQFSSFQSISLHSSPLQSSPAIQWINPSQEVTAASIIVNVSQCYMEMYNYLWKCGQGFGWLFAFSLDPPGWLFAFSLRDPCLPSAWGTQQELLLLYYESGTEMCWVLVR